MKQEWNDEKWKALVEALEKIKNGKATDFEKGVLAGIVAMSGGDKSA